LYFSRFQNFVNSLGVGYTLHAVVYCLSVIALVCVCVCVCSERLRFKFPWPSSSCTDNLHCFLSCNYHFSAPWNGWNVAAELRSSQKKVKNQNTSPRTSFFCASCFI